MKKFQEDIPQGQAESALQQVRPTQQEQHSRKPQEAVLPRNVEQFQPIPFSFINDIQYVDANPLALNIALQVFGQALAFREAMNYAYIVIGSELAGIGVKLIQEAK